MPLDDMLKVLEEDGEKQRAAVIENAKKEEEDILKAAREEGEKIKKEQRDLILAPLAREKAKILNDAKLEVKKKLAETKKDLLQRVDAQVREKIERLRNSTEWSSIFRHLLKEASQGIDGKITVKVDRRDKDMAQIILNQRGGEYNLEADSTLLDGVTVTSEDGRVTLINTFESRLERADRLLKPVITSALFGDGDGSRL